MQEDEDQVEAQDQSRRNSPKADAGPEAGFAAEARGHEACYWNDKKYSDGSTVCEAGTRHKCWNGRWVEIGLC